MVDRDRLLVAAGLASITAVAWVYAARMAIEPLQVCGPAVGGLWTTFVMWTVMMTGMMLPSASPMVLTYAGMRRPPFRASFWGAGCFVLGYVAAWTGFSALAALLQWELQRAALLTADGVSVDPLLSAGVLIAAGLFQWSSLKHRCLTKCRSPLGFMLAEWRDGPWGALHMGVKHGLYCLGCCWVLMLVVFAAGVMNLLWGVALTILVLVEKVAPKGPWIARTVGAWLVAYGLAMALA